MYNSDNPLRVFTAFSGYDSQCLALERLKDELPGFDYTLVGWSEIDKNAIKAHDLLFPEAAGLNYGDISKIDWAGQVPDFDLFTYSFPCGLKGTLVLTDKGYADISEVRAGDRVLTHNNRYRKVVRTMTRVAPSHYRIKAVGCDLRLTEEHPLYVLRDGNEAWVQVKELRLTDKVSYCIPQGSASEEPEAYLDEPFTLNGRTCHTFHTWSKEQFLECQRKIMKDYGLVCELVVRNEGLDGSQAVEYAGQFSDEAEGQEVRGSRIFVPLYGIELIEGDVDVFNFEVEEDNSYTCDNVNVHNCQSISNAGLQHGFAEGSGTRSSLLWECRKAIAAKKPQYLLMENVKALVQQNMMENFLKWLGELEDFGYANFWQVLNAKDYGVPQNRERVFCVSILIGEGQGLPYYYFPKPFFLEKRLKDVLEPEVDESYYLKQEQVDRIVEHCDRKVAEGCGFKTNFQTEKGIGGTLTTMYGSRQTDTFLKEQGGAAEPASSPEADNRYDKITFNIVSEGYTDGTRDYEIDTTCETLGELLDTLSGFVFCGYKISGKVTVGRESGDLFQTLEPQGEVEYGEHGYSSTGDVDLESRIVSVTANGDWEEFNFNVTVE